MSYHLILTFASIIPALALWFYLNKKSQKLPGTQSLSESILSLCHIKPLVQHTPPKTGNHLTLMNLLLAFSESITSADHSAT